jgi:hypothetical protein
MRRDYKNNVDFNTIALLPIVGLSLYLLAEGGLKEYHKNSKTINHLSRQ